MNSDPDLQSHVATLRSLAAFPLPRAHNNVQLGHVEGLSEEAVLLAVLQVRAAHMCGGGAPGNHISLPVWRGKESAELAACLQVLWCCPEGAIGPAAVAIT